MNRRPKNESNNRFYLPFLRHRPFSKTKYEILSLKAHKSRRRRKTWMIYWTIYKWTANVQDAQPSIWRRMMSRRRAPCGTTKLWSLIYDSSMVWTTALDVSIVCRRPSMGYAALRNGGTTRANESPGPYLSMACFLSASLAWQPGLVVEEQSNLDRFWKAVRKGQKGQNFFYLTAFNYVRFLIKLL